MMKLRERILALISSPARQRDYRRRGRVAVGNTARNACAATASQPLIELDILHRVELLAEGLATTCKRSKQFTGVANLKLAKPGDLVVCKDLNGNNISDHIWWIVSDLGGGWYECFDNQGKTLTHRRRLDGKDGKTAARGLLQPT